MNIRKTTIAEHNDLCSNGIFSTLYNLRKSIKSLLRYIKRNERTTYALLFTTDITFPSRHESLQKSKYVASLNNHNGKYHPSTTLLFRCYRFWLKMKIIFVICAWKSSWETMKVNRISTLLLIQWSTISMIFRQY